MILDLLETVIDLFLEFIVGLVLLLFLLLELLLLGLLLLQSFHFGIQFFLELLDLVLDYLIPQLDLSILVLGISEVLGEEVPI